MHSNGFIKINRKILGWRWYQNVNTFKLFIHILLTANIKDKEWQGEIIKRGELVTSVKNLAQQTGLTLQQTRTALDNLISTNEITKKTTNKYTVISVINYEKYQTFNKQNNNQITNKQQTNNKQITTTKEYKEYKEYKRSSVDTRAHAREDDDTTEYEDPDYSVPHVWGGTLGKNVLVMSDEQFDDLCERMSRDVLHKYIDKVTSFILNEGKNVRNHYATICKWYEEDYGGKTDG